MVAGYVRYHWHFCYDSMNFDDMYFTTHFALDALTKITEQTSISDVFLMSQQYAVTSVAKESFICSADFNKDTKKGQADDISSNKWVNCSNVTKWLHHCGTL